MKLLNFKAHEFACKCGCGLGSNILEMDLELLNVLEKLRLEFGKPIIINSGYRCSNYNKKIGGAMRSQHLFGTAADIVVQGIPPTQVYDTLDALYPNKYGIGRYKTFTHIDVRPNKARF